MVPIRYFSPQLGQGFKQLLLQAKPRVGLALPGATRWFWPWSYNKSIEFAHHQLYYKFVKPSYQSVHKPLEKWEVYH